MMLKHGDTCFLDDMTVENLARKLNTPILPVRGVEELIDICTK
jgi:NifB/MoaA-like Fe-S oxidoreductase